MIQQNQSFTRQGVELQWKMQMGHFLKITGEGWGVFYPENRWLAWKISEIRGVVKSTRLLSKFQDIAS